MLIPLFTSLLSLLFGLNEAELVFAGDAMMHQIQIDVAKQDDGTYDFSEYFTAIAPWVSNADYAVVNLETSISKPPYSGYPCFNAPVQYVEALADAGFDMFLTANNHTLDRNDRGLRATIANLDERHLDHIGTYTNSAARDSILPYIKDINGIKFGFLNYTYGTNGIPLPDGMP
ncbi:MAG: CapA family protein, partial [Muribaculaceae bacterium]